MERPCVRVPREAGETTRRALAEADLVDDGYEIVSADGRLYLPVTDPDAVGDYDVVYRDVPAHEPQRTPADLLPFDPSYERLGDVAILDEDDPARAERIAAAIVDSDLPVRTVLNRASKVKGDHRVREWTILATDADRDERDTGGERADRDERDARSERTERADRDERDRRPPTETVHREYGVEFLVDLASVYFSPRLATERHRVVEQVDAGERVLDMFAGVGPFAIPMAARGATVVGVDLNPAAIEYLRENARRNDVAGAVTAVEGDVREVSDPYVDWADRIVMNLPHTAGAFLDTAMSVAGDDCVLHYYDIQHEDDPFGPGESAIREAATAAGYDVEVVTRHVVRSYAPHELNVCLDVRLSR
jgi:tRNA (guanine37-N1)-methyltransferase